MFAAFRSRSVSASSPSQKPFWRTDTLASALWSTLKPEISQTDSRAVLFHKDMLIDPSVF